MGLLTYKSVYGKIGVRFKVAYTSSDSHVPPRSSSHQPQLHLVPHLAHRTAPAKGRLGATGRVRPQLGRLRRVRLGRGGLGLLEGVEGAGSAAAGLVAGPGALTTKIRAVATGAQSLGIRSWTPRS
jgi:hypothetical protein